MPINDNIPDYELVRKLHEDDVEAFDQIFKRYGDRLYGFAFKYLKSKEETEGLVQDVFLKIWENRKKLKKESSLKSYLFTIAYHNICHLFRKKQIFLKYIEESKVVETKTIDLEKQLEYQATLSQVDKLIDQLPGKQKEVFIKSRKEGKSTSEIAKEMNLSPGTVDNYISTALKLLRKQISGEDFALLLFFAFFFQ
ncbi:RNA polymerase sigma factor [Maribellus sediminis]|uniref:RNA polymerase sigma factor n=1 Tax=Maribellus sediminis TaxID=2696285 RepID=UPI00142F3E12|nr:RNA polymerase sigma-70 factor [Maribellus sediminis]